MPPRPLTGKTLLYLYTCGLLRGFDRATDSRVKLVGGPDLMTHLSHPPTRSALARAVQHKYKM
jgi:hypothetical protein